MTCDAAIGWALALLVLLLYLHDALALAAR